MNVVEKWRLVAEAKRLRERMSKLGFSRRDIYNLLWLYGVSLRDMGEGARLGKIY